MRAEPPALPATASMRRRHGARSRHQDKQAACDGSQLRGSAGGSPASTKPALRAGRCARGAGGPGPRAGAWRRDGWCRPQARRRSPLYVRLKPAAARASPSGVSRTAAPSARSTSSGRARPAARRGGQRLDRRLEQRRIVAVATAASCRRARRRARAARRPARRPRPPCGPADARLGGAALRPGQRGAERVGRVGRRQHRRARCRRGGSASSARSRSTAPGSANCAPPSPSTK